MPRPGFVPLALAVCVAAGCAWPRPAVDHPPLACAEPCASLLELRPPARAEVRVRVAPGTRLHHARLTSVAARPCTGGLAVRQVEVDGRPYSEGPATLAAGSLLALEFAAEEEDEDEDEDEGDEPPAVTGPYSVDLELRAPAGQRCLRLAVSGEDNRWLDWRHGP